MVMEENARRVGRQALEPYPTRNQMEPGNDDGTKTVSWKNWEPHSAPELFGEKTVQASISEHENMFKKSCNQP